MKKIFCKFVLLVVGISLAYGAGKMVLRQLPRKTPTQPVALRAAVQGIFSEKCADCHDSSRPAPFYAKLPVLGTLVAKDRDGGIRHWEPGDRSYLGPKATAGQKLDAPTPLTIFAKLEKVLADGSMPLQQYLFLHWGTWLSKSEKDILSTWCVNQRTDWLAQWGITNGADQAVQPIPDTIPFNAAKAALGEKLFHDKRLSSDNTVACSSCHALDKGATDNLRFSKGVGGKFGGVNAPTALNAAFNIRQFWDGRAADLAEQAGGPPMNPVEMACTNWTQITEKLAADITFKTNFIAVYPDGFSEKTICNAIAEYEKRLLTPNCRFDQYLKGHKTVLSTEEVKGYALFQLHSCAGCHVGPSMGGQSFEYADLKDDYFKGRVLTDGDKGLKAFSTQEKDNKRFKVPSLRNVALTAPYLHDGSKTTLEDAVASMMTYQVAAIYTDKDIQLLTAFLKTLTGELSGKSLEKK